MRFLPTYRMALKLKCILFISVILHLIFSVSDWPWSSWNKRKKTLRIYCHTLQVNVKCSCDSAFNVIKRPFWKNEWRECMSQRSSGVLWWIYFLQEWHGLPQLGYHGCDETPWANQLGEDRAYLTYTSTTSKGSQDRNSNKAGTWSQNWYWGYGGMP